MKFTDIYDKIALTGNDSMHESHMFELVRIIRQHNFYAISLKDAQVVVDYFGCNMAYIATCYRILQHHMCLKVRELGIDSVYDDNSVSYAKQLVHVMRGSLQGDGENIQLDISKKGQSDGAAASDGAASDETASDEAARLRAFKTELLVFYRKHARFRLLRNDVNIDMIARRYLYAQDELNCKLNSIYGHCLV